MVKDAKVEVAAARKEYNEYDTDDSTLKDLLRSDLISGPNVLTAASNSFAAKLSKLRQQGGVKSKSIFSDGLPVMGPRWATRNSNPSVPTEEKHATAYVKFASFSTLSDLGNLPYPQTNIWCSLRFGLCISASVNCFLLWEDLGQHGADGRAFLVSGGTKGWCFEIFQPGS
jgi:hypothetical protein